MKSARIAARSASRPVKMRNAAAAWPTAISAPPNAGQPIDSAARTSADDGVHVDVHDEGPGIAREDRERVFERFQRGGAADSSGGTGLGLAIARWAVGLHGGTIEVLDDPRSAAASEGRSSLIRVVLPDVGRKA